MKLPRLIIHLGALVITLAAVSCTTTKSPEVTPAAETERQTAARFGQATAPRDGIWIEASEEDALRENDESVWTDANGEPRPIRRTWRGGWNLTDNSLGGLTDADIGFGGSSGYSPRDGLRVKIGGQNVQTGNNAAAILAQGQAEAAAKGAAGAAAAAILREHYAGRVAILETANGTLVTLTDGTIGILERVHAVAAGVSVAEKAVVRLRNPQTGAASSHEIEAAP